ncbi:conserved hypothetical protein [Methanococcus maripaludis C5]|uniref:Uncharacterized protein n=1 Tax=Methanococcus maripaludis (strain C5 / ATCC BAA-1333) TaxID=402880 RepID=A4FZU7_METM5|nr:hypothetical protein [Methanococcus maripaludis]ABO35731.1 conserved hypothetical protein [Methanococcus maripaludis C5]
MIFDSDMVIAIVILTVGMAFYTSSLVEHGGDYGDTIKTNIFYDKVSSQLKDLVLDGTIETAMLLKNNNESDVAENLIKIRVHSENYLMNIGTWSIDNSNATENFAIVSTVVLINRSEGWYGFYWNAGHEIQSIGPYIDENITYIALDLYESDYKKALYYYGNNDSVNVSLKVYGE